MASLLVIQGADHGKRFELGDGPGPLPLGRDPASAVRLRDTEVSRHHAELRPGPDRTFRLVDLGSANGTYLNDRPVEQSPIRSGDRLRLGQTVLVFNEGSSAASDLTERVDLLGRASPEDRSAIIRSVEVGEGSRLLSGPESAGDWLKVRLANLAVMYQATRAISHITDLDDLLPRILDLVFDSIGADRGAILLADPGGRLVPKAVRWRGPEGPEPEERLTISRTIVDHVGGTGQGVITSDAPSDRRFGPSQSIVDYEIREAICVPVEGRHSRLGVIYADTRAPDRLGADPSTPVRFTNEHLMLLAAIGHQAGLAIENGELHAANLQAERLAAVGQTIATLSHHIKNILQGLRGGSSLIELGLEKSEDAVVRKGWGIVERNQAKIYNLVLDMLSYSKDREPSLEPTDLNAVVEEVVELSRSRAEELGVPLEWCPGAGLPAISLDPEGLHRAVLNLATNAIEACEGLEGGKVRLSTSLDADGTVARVVVEDRGAGIDEADFEAIFEPYASSKGSRGTGLGLPVSRKIVREHGGDIVVASRKGRGSRFILTLPIRPWPPPGEGPGVLETLT